MEIGLMDVMTDDTTRDLYWYDVLKFQCVLLLTTPSETVMEEVLDILEPMCDDELVHEWGANLEEEVERQDIYEHHKEAQTTLAVTKADAVVVDAVVAVGDAGDDESDDVSGGGVAVSTDPVDGDVVPYDVLAHFHGY
jgi:hypothetical protein